MPMLAHATISGMLVYSVGSARSLMCASIMCWSVARGSSDDNTLPHGSKAADSPFPVALRSENPFSMARSAAFAQGTFVCGEQSAL
jgi:hypothetical protein